MKSLIHHLKTLAKRLPASQSKRKTNRRPQRRNSNETLSFEELQPRALLATIAIADGGWTDPTIWSDGVPDASTRAIIGHGFTVELDGAGHEASELVIHGDLLVNEELSDPSQKNKSLTTRWIHVNSGGEFLVGSETNRYDDGTFTLTLTGTDITHDPVIETNMGGVDPNTMQLTNNDGFLMTAMGGRIEFYGQEKLSFTKLRGTAEIGVTSITVENFIERNFDKGAVDDSGEFVTSAEDDGLLNWEVGDQIVIASSSYDYTHEEVRIITNVLVNDDNTTTLSFAEALTHRHYGETETYGETTAENTTPASQTYEIDLRAEVALLSRNVKIQGLDSQDTDIAFGDRANVDVEAGLNVVDRVRAAGLSDAEFEAAPDKQVSIGVGGHLMFMPSSGDDIVVDGVQLDRLGQTSQKGRYPIHWHLGNDRSGDVLKNSSITNSNNRGVTIHGTQNLKIEGVVLHDIHGHGFFFEDAVETGNELVANIALGIHKVGGNDSDAANPGGTDPFVVDTHDNVLETGSRFESSAAFWITNPTNTFVGNIAAGGAGTGFWYALPRTVLGASAANSAYDDIIPVYSEFGQFDNNSSHSAVVGLNFDRGSDIEDGNFNGDLRTNNSADNYSPRTGGLEDGDPTFNYVNNFTNYKASGAGVYHRGQAESLRFNGLRIADSYNAAWAVSENTYENSLYVGHSKGNADITASVGGPRLYDGAGLHTNSHFAGFKEDTAFAFQVEGSSFGPTMYHAFSGTSFEDDGTYGNLSHAVSDFQRDPADGHDLTRPEHWSKAVIDLDGSLTSAAGGGVGYSIVPNIDFLVDSDDFQPAGWDSYLTDDIYARIRVENNNDGQDRFNTESGEALFRYTARDGEFVEVSKAQNNGDMSWSQVAAKTDSDGMVEGTFTIEFGINGIPSNGFVLNVDNQDGDRPGENPAIQAKVDAARIVVKIVGAGNYTPDDATEVFNDADLRSATGESVFFRDGEGNLFLNTSINIQYRRINFSAGATEQTTFVANRKIEYGAKIEAEEFDNSFNNRNGFGYHDTESTNSFGSSFRGDTGVDATSTKIGNIADGEWLEYTGEIVASSYKVGVNVSSEAAGGQILLMAAPSNSAGALKLLATFDVPDTGGEFTTVWLDRINLPPSIAGADSVIRLQFVGGGFEVDSVEFEAATQTAFEDREITADFTTTSIQLEAFDDGGQGAAYYDNEPGNSSSEEYRTDEDVDVDAGGITGRVFDGEWLEYTTDIQPGLYDVSLFKTWGGVGSGVKLFVGMSNSATSLDLLGTFDFATGDLNEVITLSDVDLTDYAGTDRVIRIEIIGNWMGLDRIDFVSKTNVAPTADIVDVTPELRNTDAGVVTIDFDEDVVGVDINDLTLTRDGNQIDISGLTVTQVSPRQYTVDLSTVTSVDGTYELHLNSSNSGIEDLAGNALATDAIDQFMIDMTGPQVETVVVNGGDVQRSRVTELTVTFSEVVNGVDASSFILTNTTTNTQVVPVVSTEVVGGKTVATLTFSGAGIVGGSLADGNYTLTTLDTLTDAVGNQLDGDGDGISGGNATDDFFRLFGDVNGDRRVNIVDFFQFRNAFRGPYNAAFDANGDGVINIIDFFQFRSRFGSSL
ncbi:MAG: G8 domain-containing protein [Mariniblastus sp.]